MISAIFFAWKPQPSAGQRMSEIPPNRKPACSVFCGDATMNYVVLAEPPACWGGPLPAGSAGDHFRELPKDAQNMICKNLKSTDKTGRSCPVFKTLMAACGGDEKESPKDQPPETQPSPPAGGSPGDPPDDCKDRQHVRFTRLGKNYVYIACGKVIGRFHETADPSWVRFIESLFPSKDTVCCGTLEGESFECQRFGIDCDNYYPEVDPNVSLKELLDSLPSGAEAPDPLPQGLRRQEILPGSACDGGKWELLKGNNRCKAKDKSTSLVWYEATWKCPKTGVKVSKASSPTLLQQKCK